MSMFEQILRYWRQRSTEMHYIQWGDYKSWQAGFENEPPSRGRLVYDQYCRNILDFANSRNVTSSWVTYKELATIPTRADGWHYSFSAQQSLQVLLQTHFHLPIAGQCAHISRPIRHRPNVTQYGAPPAEWAFYWNQQMYDADHEHDPEMLAYWESSRWRLWNVP